MAKYIRTQRPSQACSTLLKTTAALVLLSVLATLPVSAQNGAPGGRSAQAVLHIKINIVPVVQPPPVPEKPLAGVVTYNVPMNSPTVDVIENVQVLPGSVVRSGVAVGTAVLKTLTIVTK